MDIADKVVLYGFCVFDTDVKMTDEKTGMRWIKFARRHGFVRGCVAEALAAAVERRNKEQPDNDLYIRVLVQRDDGLFGWYRTKVPPGESSAAWEPFG